MNRIILKYSLYALIIILIQVLVLNNIQLSSYLNPYAYLLLILILPFDTPGWALLAIGFVLGFTIDVFPQGLGGHGGTLGIHAAATVFAAFIRPSILRWINPRDEYEQGTLPGASDYGFRWFFLYAVLIFSAHHSLLFLLEDANLVHLPQTLLRILGSVLFSLVVVFIWEAFRYKRRQ